MRISDWSSDVCSSDLLEVRRLERQIGEPFVRKAHRFQPPQPFGIARQAVAAHFLFGRADLGDAFEEPHVVTRNAVDLGERPALADRQSRVERSEESPVGKECVSTGRSWWSK